MAKSRLSHDKIVELHEPGLSRREIAKRIGTTPGSISSTLSRLGLQKYKSKKSKRRDYEVLYDPQDIFQPGRLFPSSDIKASLKMKTWPVGMRFRVMRTGNIVEVVNGKDKQRLVCT